MAAGALYNLARMDTATTGTGTITLGSAVSGYLSFASAGVSNGDVVSYGIIDGASSEHGYGTYTSAGTTLTRNVTNSTNGGSAITLSGSAQVFICPRSEDILSFVRTQTFTAAEQAKARSNLGITAFTSRGDANYTLLNTDRVVGITTAFTAQRTWALPAASTYPTSIPLIIVDMVAGISSTNSLIVNRAGSDTISGVGTSTTVDAASNCLILYSDGVSNWSQNKIRQNGTGVGQNLTLSVSGQLPALDGSLLTALNATQLTTGTIPDARLNTDISSVAYSAAHALYGGL